jgi:hypothetical protein
MYDIGLKTVFSGGPICVLYRRDPVGIPLGFVFFGAFLRLFAAIPVLCLRAFV